MKCPCDKCKISYTGCKNSCLDYLLFKRKNPDHVEVFVKKKSVLQLIKEKLMKP